MYISSDIPESFNKIAEISDNYIVLVEENKLYSNNSYEAYYQFIYPSIYTLHLDDYVITKGNDYSWNYDYINNQYFTYLSDSTAIFSYDCMTLEDRSSELFDRADYPLIMIASFVLVFCFVWLINQFSKVIQKGGVFG